jgi:hypothetical protein
MKRQELILEIATNLTLRSFDKDLANIKPFNWDIALLLAEEALNTVEESGMLPPRYIKEELEGRVEIPVHEWEPED